MSVDSKVHLEGGAPCLKDGALWVDGVEVPLLSGALHYWRLPQESWRPAIISLRDLGFSIVETYAPWQVHEVHKGKYDFGQTDPRKDLGRFIDIVKEEGMHAFVRPGPHINAEMTYFGLPERVVYESEIQAKSPSGNPVILFFPPRMFPVPSHSSNAYHDELGQWYDAVAKVVVPRLHPKGPIVLMQVDNEASYFFRNGPYCQDYHPDAVALFRDFLLSRYGNLKKLSEAHQREYDRWDQVRPPTRFDAKTRQEWPLHLDWASFQEFAITHAVRRMKKRMFVSGMKGVPMVHNVALGEAGQPISPMALSEEVDLLGFDYYHPAREHRTIKRRTLYLAGTQAIPYAPEMGAGAPAWFTPLSHDDSLYCAMAASAFGLRGFNLYMAVDRDRWYGAPIDARGKARSDALGWKKFLHALIETKHHALTRKADVALVIPRQCTRLARATHLLGPASPSSLEAIGGSPVDACSDESFGLPGPMQILWWNMLSKSAAALTEAQIPYVYVDSDCPPETLGSYRALIAPTFEMMNEDAFADLAKLSNEGTYLVVGPALPSFDEAAREYAPEPIPNARLVLLDTPDDARRMVAELMSHLDLSPPVKVGPVPLEATVHTAEGSDTPHTLFIMNPGKDAKMGHITLSADLPHRVFLDAMTGESFEGQHFEVAMKPFTCRFLIAQPLSNGGAS